MQPAYNKSYRCEVEAAWKRSGVKGVNEAQEVRISNCKVTAEVLRTTVRAWRVAAVVAVLLTTNCMNASWHAAGTRSDRSMAPWRPGSQAVYGRRSLWDLSGIRNHLGLNFDARLEGSRLSVDCHNWKQAGDAGHLLYAVSQSSHSTVWSYERQCSSVGWNFLGSVMPFIFKFHP